jgi:hypothetical protein
MKKYITVSAIILLACLLFACSVDGEVANVEGAKMTAIIKNIGDKIEVDVIEGDYEVSGIYWVNVGSDTVYLNANGVRTVKGALKVGDTIEIANGRVGVVKKIMIFTTELRTFDNQVVFLPNGTLANGEITNLSLGEVRRTDINISIAYGDKVSDARKVILDILKKDKRVLIRPVEPLVILNNLGDSGVELIVRYWTKYENAYVSSQELREKIYEALPKKKINFPFPQMDVHIIK